MKLYIPDNYRKREKKPAFIIKPRRCFADEGGLGKFKASVEGEPEPSVEWQRDGVALVPSDKHRVSTRVALVPSDKYRVSTGVALVPSDKHRVSTA